MPVRSGLPLLLILVSDVRILLSIPASDNSAVNFIDSAMGIPDPVSDIAPCPDGKHFCESMEVPDYPIVTNSKATDFTNIDVISELATRAGNFVQESRACDVRKSIVKPRKAKDLTGNFRYILNNQDYVQELEIEECVGEGKHCRVDSDAPKKESTFCRQKYANYQLVSIDKEGKDTLNSYKLPSACLCYYAGGSSSPDDLGLRSILPDINKLQPICPVIAELVEEGSPVSENENVQKSGQSNTGDRVIFQDEASFTPMSRGSRHTERIRGALLNKLKPSGCSGNTFCEESPSYPSDLINNIVRTETKIPSKIKNKFFKYEEECLDVLEEIATRQFNINEEQLCVSSKRIIIPQQALNIKNEWKYIVNIGNYTQSVSIEECLSSKGSKGSNSTVNQDKTKEFGSCLYGGVTGNNPNNTVCRQLFREHKLLVVTPKGELEIDQFSLPSACGCFVRKDFQEIEF